MIIRYPGVEVLRECPYPDSGDGNLYTVQADKCQDFLSYQKLKLSERIDLVIAAPTVETQDLKGHSDHVKLAIGG